MQEYDRSAQGGAGFKNVTAGPELGNFVYLVVDSPTATFSALSDIDGSDDLADETRSEGVVIPGKFKSVTVTAGRVRAYKNGKV